MTRPQTVQDVFEVLSQHRLVESARLDAFIRRHQPADVPAMLEHLVADGLLTAFQANEVANGHGARLWLGGYRVLDRLGRGGMGNVFLAEHAVLGRRVAVKALSDSLRADPGARKRFVREARAAAALDHPNIVHVFDVNMVHEPPYLVMEYVDGVSLQAAVSHTGTFSVGEAAAVGVQVADGLVQAAAVGLVHRDIKPANVLVDRRGAVKILDLGIVRFTHDDTHSRVNPSEVILGTLDYLSPEQAEDSSKVDARADIYALGATLYFLLAGHPPYPITDVRRKLAAKRMEDPPPIHQLRPDVPADFSALLGRLMARDPAERIPAPAMAVSALHPWAAPGADFPNRLFRLTSDSTAHGRRLTDHEPSRPDSLPETIIILKTSRRGAGESGDPAGSGSVPPPAPARALEPVSTPEPVEPAEPAEPADPTSVSGRIGSSGLIDLNLGAAALTADTQGGGCAAAPTDEMVALPDELRRAESALPETAVLKAVVLPAAAPGPSPGRAVKFALAAVVLIGVVAALILLFVR